MAVPDPAGRGIIGMHADGLASLDFGRPAELAHIQLAVQPGPRVVGNQDEREPLGRRRSEPFRRLVPLRVPSAVVIMKSVDGRGEDLDASARRVQRRALRVGA